MKDYSDLIKEIEKLFKDFLKTDKKPGLAIAMTLPPGYKDVHWMTNLSRDDGISLFQNTAKKMKDLRREN
jgi:hypothetical protein